VFYCNYKLISECDNRKTRHLYVWELDRNMKRWFVSE